MTTIKAPIEKFGGGPDHSPEANKQITEMKRKSLFKLNINSSIILVISIALIGHFFVPEVLTNQVTLLIVAAAIVSPGIKLGTTDLK